MDRSILPSHRPPATSDLAAIGHETQIHTSNHAPVLVRQRQQARRVLHVEALLQDLLARGLEPLHAVHVRGRVQLDRL